MTGKEQAEKIIAVFRRLNPHPATELSFETPWQLLVATVLSAQSTDKQVNKVTQKLFQEYPGPQEMAGLSEAELAEKIKTLGLYRTKSKNLVATARIITEKYAGKVPRTREELEQLPGVGRKTANVILANAFNLPALAVDTHVFRVANRTGLAKAETPLAVEAQLTRLLPERLWKDAHHWLILHGRYVCTARNPKCNGCPIRAYCSYQLKNTD
ncbi:MAG TPA: endonuclease III [Firmicutes bacterium]|nr:endonuclease III [Bacillota bacterium]